MWSGEPAEFSCRKRLSRRRELSLFGSLPELRTWIETTLSKNLPQCKVQVLDLTGGGDHFQATVISPEFRGKSMVLQHRMVYDALGDAMKDKIHALVLKTMTPEQWDKVKGESHEFRS